MDLRSYEFAAPTMNDNNLPEFPTFETDEDNMACSNSKPTDKPHQGSNEYKTSQHTSSFSQNFGKELSSSFCQAPSYNKPSNSDQNEYQADSAVTDSCEVVDTENKCSKPSYENNPMDKLMFMQNNYFSST